MNQHIPEIDELHSIYNDEMGERLFFSCKPLLFDDGEHVTKIPSGFLSDGFSIPAIIQPLINTPKAPRWIAPAIWHDWMYKIQPDKNITRKEVDKQFKNWMKLYGIGFRRHVIYHGVRIGGWKSWKKKHPHFKKSQHH